MALKGDLSAVGLSDLFQMLSMGQKEGTLVVRDKKRTKRIFFSLKGISLLSQTKGAREELGQSFVRRGKITAEQLSEVIAEQKQTGKRHWELMVDRGWVTRGEMDGLLRAKIEDEIYDLFLWRDATFEFEEGELTEQADTMMRTSMQLKFDVNALLMEALRRVDEWGRINEKVSGLHCVFAYVDEAARAAVQADPGGADAVLAAYFDGTRSLEEIRTQADCSSFDVCRTALALVTDGKLVELPTAQVLQAARDADAAGQEDVAVRLYRAVVSSPADEGGEVDVVLRCAELCQKTGLVAEALIWFKRLADAFRDANEKEGLARILTNIVDLDPDNIEASLELFDLWISGPEETRPKAEALGQQLLKMAEARDEPETARDVASKLVVAQPHDMVRRMVLVRILVKMKSDSELREELRTLVKNLQPGDPQHEPMLQELRTLAPEFFREEYLPPTPTKLKAKRLLRTWGMVAGVLVACAVGAGVVLYMLPDPGNTTKKNGKTGPVGPVEFDAAAFAARLEAFDKALEEGDLDKAEKTLANARSIAELAAVKEKVAECDGKKGALAVERTVKGLLDQVKDLKEKGKIPEAAAIVRTIIKNHDQAHASRGIKVPVRVTAIPDGVKIVAQDGSQQDTPTVLELLPSPQKLTFRRPGFADHHEEVTEAMLFSGQVSVTLNQRSASWDRQPGGTPAPGTASAMVGTGALFVPVGKTINAYKPASGDGLPPLNVSGTILLGPVVVGTTILVVDKQNQLLAFDAPTPTKRDTLTWSPKKLPGPPTALVPSGAGVVLVSPAALHLLDLASGEIKPLGEPVKDPAVVAGPVAVGASLVLARADGAVHVLDAAGTPRTAPIKLGAKPPIFLAALGERFVAATSAGKVRGFDGAGKPGWEATVKGGEFEMAAGAGDTLLLGSRDGTLLGIDWGAAEPRFTIASGARLVGAPTVTEKWLYVASEDGFVRVYPRQDPRQPVWTFGAGEKITQPPVVSGAWMFVMAGSKLFGVKAD